MSNSLVNTLMLGYREKSAGQYKYQERIGQLGALDAALQDNTVPNGPISPNLRARAEMAIGLDVKVPVFDQQTVTTTNTRPLVLIENELTSQLVTLSFTVIQANFLQTPTAFRTNNMSVEDNFNEQLAAIEKAIGQAVDTSVVSALSTNKTQIFGLDPASLLYSNTGSVVTADYTKRENILGDLVALQFGNDFQDTHRIITNGGGMSIINQMKEKGVYNDVNRTLQFGMFESLHYTNRISNGSDYMATGYAVQKGSLGICFQHEADSMAGSRLADGTEWGMSTLPNLGIPIDTYYYEGRADKSALWGGSAVAHLTRTPVQAFGFSIGYCVLTTYNQSLSTLASPIMAFQVAKT